MATPAEHTLVAAFLEQMPDLVCFKDREHRCLAASRSLAARHGADDPADLIGQRDEDRLSTLQARRSRDEESAVIATGEPVVKRTEQILWPDGKLTWSHTSTLPLRNGSGDTIGVIRVSEDCTEARQTELSLEKVQKELVSASRLAGMAEVATGVLHNVGNVLSSLNVSSTAVCATLRDSKAQSLTRLTELLQANQHRLEEYFSSDPDGQQIPELLFGLARHVEGERSSLLREVDLLQKHIDHIKEIVSMQQSYARMAGVVESLSAAELVDDSLRMNSAALVRHDVNVERQIEIVPSVRAERGKTLQILINLIRNAKYAIDERPQSARLLTLRVRRGAPGWVRISVEDTGVGIPPERLTKIFSHGFTTRPQGHGFGLHSSSLAASEMGGKLSVESAGVNCGATFHLDLPELPA